MHTSAFNVYAAGDVALAYNVTAWPSDTGRTLARRTPAGPHRRTCRCGLIRAAWSDVPEFTCAIGESS
jgi:hypothetical protein